MRILFLLLPLLFISCSIEQAEFEKRTGKTNPVEEGKRFRINLSEDHKEGFLWSVNHDYNDTLINYLSSIYHSNNGGSVDFNFIAVKKGKTEIHLNKSMAQDTTERVTFVIEVK